MSGTYKFNKGIGEKDIGDTKVLQIRKPVKKKVKCGKFHHPSPPEV